jgi:hypothetical protein
VLRLQLSILLLLVAVVVVKEALVLVEVVLVDLEQMSLVNHLAVVHPLRPLLFLLFQLITL